MHDPTLHEKATWTRARRHLCRQDPILGQVVRQAGELLPLKPRGSRFESLAAILLGQQISVQAAATVRRRLRERLGGRLDPAALLALDAGGYRACGVSRQKREYLQDLARKHCDGTLKLRSLRARSDEEIIQHLCQVRGIGRWTAEMFLLFHLGRPDVLSLGDLGLQNAVRKLYGLTERPTPAQFQEIAADWRPWRSVASWYLWSTLGGPIL
jgi:DNA-3-methyladenine glycosylase II